MVTLETNLSTSSSSSAVPSTSDHSMLQIGGGPAGVLYSLANELIQIYNDLQVISREIAILQTSVQKETVNAGADAQREAAYAQKYALFCNVAEALSSAVVTGGTQALSLSKTKTLTDDMRKLEQQVAPLKTLDEAASRLRNPAEILIGQPTQANVDAQVRNFSQGNFSDVSRYSPADNEAAIRHLQTRPNTQDYDNFRKHLSDEIKRYDTPINSKASELQTESTKYNTIGTAVTSVTSAAAKGVEAYNFTAKAGEEQAAMQVAQTIQGMADNAQKTASGNLGQQYSKVSEALQTARSGSVYPNG
jgi:hypothetical protein